MDYESRDSEPAQPQPPSALALWRWPLVALIFFVGVLFVANRFVGNVSKSLAPTYNTSTVIQTSVTRLRQEAKLVVLSADVTVDVQRTNSKIVFDLFDLGDTVVTVRAKGNRAQYFLPLDEIKESDFKLSNDNHSLTVTLPPPRVDESIVEVQSDPDQIEVKTDIGWGRMDKRSGELARAEAKRSLREAVVREAKTPVFVELARKNAREKVSALLTPLVTQLQVTNLAIEFRNR
jgi:hypothetical protein